MENLAKNDLPCVLNLVRFGTSGLVVLDELDVCCKLEINFVSVIINILKSLPAM
jgi:hypothetical protein